jgi:hypothetical protein
LLQHFYDGLDKESAHHLDLTSGGSFAHLTPTESREVFDKILDITSFVCIHEPIPTEPEMHQAESSEIESEPPESLSIDSTYETAPEHKSEISEEEDPLPLEFLRSIEPDVFEDFGNTSRYFCQKRPPNHVTPADPLEENFLREIVQELATLISDEWLKESHPYLQSI